MAGLADWLEDYRNWRGRQEWEQGKGWQDFFGGDPRAQEQFEKLSGFGTDAGGLVGMIKASHGSPHAFTKFDFSKIGTGEGAQAYGHGGYFAQGFDSPTAKQYQKDLSNFYEPFLGNRAGSELSDMDLDVLKALEIGKRDAGQFPHNTVYYAKKYAEGKPELLSALNELPRDVKFGERLNQGNLYNVELRWPDAAREAADPLGEHHLLDWDAQLNRQPADILDLLQKSNLYTQNIPASMTDIDEAKKVFSENKTKENLDALHKLINQGRSPTGSMFYRELQNKIGNEKASEQLRKAGIPGIRYLDQASRGAGEGTRNYVMFDDALANIVSRNGVSLSDLLRR